MKRISDGNMLSAREQAIIDKEKINKVITIRQNETRIDAGLKNTCDWGKWNKNFNKNSI